MAWARVPRPRTAKPTAGKALALAVCARQSLVADCFVIQVAQALDIFEYLVDRLHDGVDVGSRTEEDLVRKPDRLTVRCLLRFRTGIHGLQVKRLRAAPAQRGEVGGIQREQRAAID